ncbi:anti-sigma factor [Microbacterium sp. 4R-513]|uniref:anti-sigma factor n=1 Tax=Microbacterium sp. 4R-513 TaxID=2567934 RepID=UPI0013E10338|nr:anti-sigma factor [Microbacterium sp. 4R-513]QIG39364.1 anti-sigma factor [Microbacterium sp. 4R-513]
MSHLDPEQLALIALGEPVASAAEREHLASCDVCAADVAEMSHAAVVARSTMDDAELEAPPDRVWARIAEELRLGGDVTSDAVPSVGAASPAPASPVPAQTMTDATPPAEASVSSSSARPRRGRWSQRAWWALAASVALVLVIGGGVWVGLGSLAPTSIASASLEAFPDHPKAVGTAEVDESRDGSRTLTVTLDGAASSGEYREVWLIRNDGGALISLGVLDGKKGSFPIPEGVDLSEYDLVDISFEPVDGDPAHSGDSIVRGQLSFA